MTRSEIQSCVADLMSITVGRPIPPKELVSRGAEPNWDSLKHVQLVLMLEEEFGVQFSEREMAELHNSDEIVNAIEKKNAA